MNIDGLDPRRLRFFIAVAEERSFTQASRRLRVSQPSLSATIRSLEDVLDSELLTRTTRTVALTRAGEGLLEHATRILADLERAADHTRRAAEGRAGSITVGFGGLQLFDLMPTILSTLRTLEPELHVEVHRLRSVPSDHAELLRDRHIDVSHISGSEDDALSGITVAVVGAARPAMIVPRSHPLASASTATLSQFANDTFVVESGNGPGGSAAGTLRACYAAGFTPKLLPAADDLLAQFCLAAAGFGVSLALLPLGEFSLPNATWIPLSDFPIALPMTIATRDQEHDPAVHRYVSIARQILDASESRKS